MCFETLHVIFSLLSFRQSVSQQHVCNIKFLYIFREFNDQLLS